MESTAEKLSTMSIAGDDGWASSAPTLRRNLQILSPDQIELARMLLLEGQTHLFAHWPEAGVDDQNKKSFFEQRSKSRRVTLAIVRPFQWGLLPISGFYPNFRL